MKTTLFRDFGTFANLMAQNAPCRTIKGDEDWAFGKDWPDEDTTREGILAGRAPASVERAYDTARQSIAATMDASDTQGITRRRVHRFADDGDGVNIDRYLSGRADCWDSTTATKTARIVRIGFNICLSATNDPADFARLAANCAAACDWLTVRGFGVEVVGIAANPAKTTHRNYDNWVYRWTIKGPTDPLDVSSIMAFGAPGALRRFVLDQAEEDMPGMKWNAPADYSWNTDRRAACGVDYVISRQWTGANCQDILEGIEH